MACDDVVGLILAGGRGSRHAGADKGWLDFAGRPLVEQALQKGRDCNRVLISANRNIERYESLGVPVVQDQRADFQGPLSGIESAFAAGDADWLYVVPVDVVGVPQGWCEHLLEAAKARGMPWCGTRDGERTQPLLGVWSRELLEPLSAYLDQGERRVMQFLQPWLDHAQALPPGVQLRNLNKPESLV